MLGWRGCVVLVVVLELLLLACGPAPEPDLRGPVAGWPDYGGGPEGQRYSPLTQINRDNVASLAVAWTYHSGDIVDGSGGELSKSAFQSTPILLDDTLYFCTPKNRVVALDARTGVPRWSYNPGVDVSHIYGITCRGVSHWRDPLAQEGARCRDRIITGTLDARLIALDARSGTPCPDFGVAGSVDLTHGIGESTPGEYGVTSPPTVVDDRIITGTMVLDNRRVDAPGGVVRAYDARSGALLWAWDPVPEGTPPPAPGVQYRRGTTNAWSIFSADAARGLVYVPTGNTQPDYFGGLRGNLEKYSSSVVALDVRSGHVVWHFQTVHHDVWDYDVPAQPTLFEFPGRHGPIPALVQPTKMGHLFVLNRETGEALFPVEERPVPQAGAVAGEHLSPTQPFPVKPPRLHPAHFGADDAFGFTPWDRGKCREAVAKLHADGIFTPPSLEGSIQYPGFFGGMNWGGAAVDPQQRLLVVNTQRVAAKMRLIPRAEFEAMFPNGPPAYGFEPQEGTPYALERAPLLSPLGAPCSPPPWGTLTAVDLARGEVRWEVTLGTTRDQAPFPIWLPLGTPNLGGPVITASGLVFIGATTDFFLRAFDLSNGKELWRGRLPTAAQSTPMTYRLGQNGRQFVVIAAGGHGLLGTPPGDALVAFSLP